jgi:ParB family chromosome partitioning protein
MGEIGSLAASMAESGLLHPIVTRPDGALIAGERRLRAVQQLGWKEIPATVIDLEQIVRGEFAENTYRKDFTLSESVAIKRALEPAERAAAKERQGERTDKHLENFSTSSKGRALDKVAAVVGKHRATIAKAEAFGLAWRTARPAVRQSFLEELFAPLCSASPAATGSDDGNGR